jgi:hypothetical protein
MDTTVWQKMEKSLTRIYRRSLTRFSLLAVPPELQDEMLVVDAWIRENKRERYALLNQFGVKIVWYPRISQWSYLHEANDGLPYQDVTLMALYPVLAVNDISGVFDDRYRDVYVRARQTQEELVGSRTDPGLISHTFVTLRLLGLLDEKTADEVMQVLVEEPRISLEWMITLLERLKECTQKKYEPPPLWTHWRKERPLLQRLIVGTRDHPGLTAFCLRELHRLGYVNQRFHEHFLTTLFAYPAIGMALMQQLVAGIETAIQETPRPAYTLPTIKEMN